MFHSSVKRLIWKEFRAQWHVWVSLLIGAFLLQLLFVVPGSFFDTIGNFPFYVALTLTFCLAATCGALLFAGEREESTVVLLQSLPISKSRLAVSKLLFAIVSILSFGAATTGLAAIVWSTNPGGATGFLTWEHLLEGYLPGIFGCLLWSLFYSLLLSRVMIVIVCAVVTEFVITGLVTNPLSDYANSEVLLRLAFYVLLAVVDLWLLGRWWRNEPVSLPWAGRTRSETRSKGWSFDVSLPVIRWASARQTLGMRTFAVLLWRELRAAIPFIFWWGLLGILVVDLSVRVGGLPGNFVWVYLTPVICGLMTCLGDQHQQSYRFLAQRGLNGPTVWLSKHVVWLSVAVALVCLFVLYDSAFEGRFITNAYRGDVPTIARAFSNDLLRTWHSGGYPFEITPGLVTTNVLCHGSLLYVVGHLCSLWLRGPVIAGAVALVVTPFLVIAPLVLVGLDIPLMLTLAPLTLVITLGTLWTTGAWLRDESTWSQLFKRVAWVTIPVIACVLGSVVYRAEQIPDVGPGFNWNARRDMERIDPEIHLILPREIMKMKRQLSIVLKMDNQANLARGEKAFELNPDGSGEVVESVEKLTDEQRTIAIDELVLTVNEIASILGRTSGKLRGDSGMISQNYVGNSLAVVAQLLRTEGRLDASWQLLRDGLVIDSTIEENSMNFDAWWRAQRELNRLWMEISRWGADPEQTIEHLQEAIDWLDAHPMNPQRLGEVLKNQYVYQRQLIERTHPDWESQIQNQSIGPTFYSSPWMEGERRRVLKLLGVVTHAYLAEFDVDSPPLHISEADINRWLATTPTAPLSGYSRNIEQGINIYSRTERMSHAIRNGAQVVLRLQLYRLEHGHYPERLDQLPGGLTQELIRDPLGSGQFGYAPDGFPLPVRTSGKETFRAGVPLLWSTGDPQGELIRYGESHYASSNIQVKYLPQVPSDIVDLPPLEADQRRSISFVILGSEQ